MSELYKYLSNTTLLDCKYFYLLVEKYFDEIIKSFNFLYNW